MDKIKVEDIGDMLGKYMQQTGWTKLCLLLDYDGYGLWMKFDSSEEFIMMTLLRTLAPHGSHPDLTVLPAETRAVLQRLADMPEVSQISLFASFSFSLFFEVFVAVITGRCIPDIKNKVGIKNITYAGNHGIDIRHPDGTRHEIGSECCWYKYLY